MPEANRPASWLIIDSFGNRMGQVQAGSLTDAAPVANGRHLRVCVPGSCVMLLYADIPSNNAQKILQAVPYALEDKLAEDVDTLHFAVGARGAQGYLVTVVSRPRVQQWLDQLTAAGLTATELIPDMLALPVRAHTLILVPDERQILMRFPDGTGVAAEASLIPLMIRRYLSSLTTSNTCTHALVYASDEAVSPEIRDMLASLKLETTYRPLNGGAMAVMAPVARDSNAINLLQGEFGRRGATKEHWQRWRFSATLLTALCLVFIAQQLVSEFRLRHEAADLNAQVTTLFHQALPNATHMVDPEVQMKQRLTQLTGEGANSTGLLAMLTSIGNALQSQNGVQLQSLSYHDGNLQLQIQAGSIDALNNVKSVLTQSSSLHVEMDSLNSTSGTTTGRLTISEDGG
ncbi:MAG TPA: type II secretion system protein GspL [Gammaproteobacteria bacterium]|nr:type II secretion system protein GspL [Gammaproteobacteria bacterium]